MFKNYEKNGNIFTPLGEISEKLDSNLVYTPKEDYRGTLFLSGNEIKTDEIFNFSESITDLILNDVTTFWDKSEVFKSHGFLHRRGVMLHGFAGNGKTTIINLIIKDTQERGGIVLNCCVSPLLTINAINAIRDIEPDRPVLCLFEDIDTIISKYKDEELLRLLDGSSSANHILNVATTNYPENLDDRFMKRPKRFDRIYEIKPPTDKVKLEFLNNKNLGLSDGVIKYIVENTPNYSFAQLSELIICITCFDKDVDEALETLNIQSSENPSSSQYDSSFKVGKRSVGFNRGNNECEEQIKNSHLCYRCIKLKNGLCSEGKLLKAGIDIESCTKFEEYFSDEEETPEIYKSW